MIEYPRLIKIWMAELPLIKAILKPPSMAVLTSADKRGKTWTGPNGQVKNDAESHS